MNNMKPAFDIWSGHAAPEPYWCYELSQCGYKVPTRHKTMADAVEFAQKHGEVRNVNGHSSQQPVRKEVAA